MTGDSDDFPSLESVKGPLAKQADEIIDKETDWIELAQQLDVRLFERRDGCADWHVSTPFRPMFLSYLWAVVEGESQSGIPDRLRENPPLAEAFGFDVDDLPSESTFKPCRFSKGRFKDLKSTVELAAEHIRNIAAERGAPIGFSLGQTNDSTDEEDQSITKRTEQRLLRQNRKKVLEELQTVAIPSMSLPRPDDAVYDDDELLILESIAAIKRQAANAGGVTMGDKKNPDPETAIDPGNSEGDGDPFYEDGPSGETLLEAMKEMSVDEIAEVMNFALRKTYTRAKPRLQELQKDNGSRFGARTKIALDITYVAYYGDREEMEWVQGVPDDRDKGYNWCHKFATAVIVGENTHYIIAVCPLGSIEYADTDSYPGEDRSHYKGNVVRRLLSIANDYVNIRMVYADRGFYSADVIHTLEIKDLDYVIPAKKDKDRIGPICEDFDELKRGYDEDNDTPLYVKDEHAIRGPVKHEATNTRVAPSLVILPPDEDDDTHEQGSSQPFIVSFDVSDEIALDRRWTKKQIEQYKDRGAIENSYSSVKKCAAWTTSKEFEVRWFHFAFACIVYNMWLLVDFLIQEQIGVIETREKPRITLRRFLDWTDDLLKDWLEEMAGTLR